jgi:Protein of unknown function (DUF3052)
MGLEKTCEVEIGGKTVTAKVQLESTELIVGGALKMKIPLAEVTSHEAKAGQLRITRGKEKIRIVLGPDAEKWAQKIRYPKGRLDKLGIKPGMRVAVIGIDEAAFREELAGRTEDVAVGKAKRETDVVVVALSDKKDLPRLDALRPAIKKNGAIWVVWPKGRKEFREDDVRAYGPKAGLVDVKVMSFSDTLSGLKMVIPVKER